MLTIQNIYEATERVNKFAIQTPLVKNNHLSKVLKKNIFCKLESLQVTNAFKIRGNANAIPLLSAKQKRQGLITTSTGNHGLGFACVAKALHIDAVVVVPETAPKMKVVKIQESGARIISYGKSFSEAYKYAHKIASEEKRQYIGSFDNEPFFAGNATTALEILKEIDDLDVIIGPIGGGGLMAGVAFTAKQLKPSIKIYGVQSEGAPAMYRSIKENKLITLPATHTIADGVAVNQPSLLRMEYVKKYVDDILLVSDDDIKDALSLLHDESKLVVEGAGAASTAALIKYQQLIPGKKIALIITGGNINQQMLIDIIQEKYH